MSLPTINPEDAKRLIDEGAILVDIRGADERAREFVPGSHHGPLGSPARFDESQAPMIFHCRSGVRTVQNAQELRQVAPGEAYILEGGLDAWKRAGLPTKM